MNKLRSCIMGFLTAALLASSVTVQAAAVNNGTQAAVATDQVEGWPKAPAINSETAVLLDARTGGVVYDKGKDEIRYPASITKIMTLLVALENSSLKDQVTFTETGVRDVKADSSNIGMQVGEVLSMKDCLNAAIIQSANEVCAQVAEYVGGSEERFVEMMNQRAVEIGCRNTHFANASGLPDENHYTTAHDMAKIMREGLKNKNFRKIIGKVNYSIPATNMSDKRVLHTHVPMLAGESPLFYNGCIGGKTGYTQEAMNTMVVAAERDGITYIAVTMRTPDLGLNCSDSMDLFDYGFANFEQIQANEQGILTVPKGVAVDEMETNDTEKDGERLRQYFYHGQYVGVGRIGVPTPVPTTEASLEQTGQNGEDKPSVFELLGETEEQEGEGEPKGLSDTAKLLLIIMGCMLAVLMVLLTALKIKNKKRRRRVK